MRNLKFLALAFSAILTSLSFTACSDEDNKGEGDGEEIANVHYDVWVTVGQSSGMGKTGDRLVKSTNSLEEQKEITFKNEGCDVTAFLNSETIIKGKYYYQAAPLKQGRFGKYQIINNEVRVIAERPFKANTYQDRRYSHAWLSDDEFVVMAANGTADEVIWTKLKDKGNSLEIVAEGDLGLSDLTKFKKFSTSGLAKYRKSDNTIIYAFQNKNVTTSFFVAFIDAATMKVKSFVEEKRAEQMAGSAYGELLQNKMFFDDNENLYIACNSLIKETITPSTTCQYGALLRIKNGEMDFDKNYKGYNHTGKLVTADYLGNNKAVIYIQDPEYTGVGPNNDPGKWGDKYNCYYALLDLTTDQKEEFTYNSEKLPYSSGTFSQRSFVLNGKAYIGVNPEHSSPAIYIYDSKTNKVTKGTTIKEGFNFNRIVYITD